jgi:hypothetical protein
MEATDYIEKRGRVFYNMPRFGRPGMKTPGNVRQKPSPARLAAISIAAADKNSANGSVIVPNSSSIGQLREVCHNTPVPDSLVPDSPHR